MGRIIQTSLDDVRYNDASIRRKEQVKILQSLQLTTNATQEVDPSIDPSIMFNRMVTVTAREDDIEEFFKYELTQEPMSLFKGGLMRKPDKASLRKIIMPETNVVQKEDIKNCYMYVIDGGSLLHRVRWSQGTRFSVIAELHTKYLFRNYKSGTTIIFDGHHGQSTKDHEHMPRNAVPQSSNVNIHAENHAPFTQDRFLSNTENKAGLVRFLTSFKRRGISCLQLSWRC